ncbi:hypothetical protein [Leucobacter salsicius]|uniref:hypothetical protein n=1 Tax=Leucobacter salsicius TaxID=664638 RepID=UPI00034AA58A|nr:hypothetical protein [Leucobacter salsicius]
MSKVFEPEDGARTLFWVLAGIGMVVLPVSWVWYGLTLLEEESEQGKALTAGATMEGTAALFGLFPLVVAHLIGLGLLLFHGWRGWGPSGLGFGIIAVVVASVAGLIFAQMLYDGELFNMGIQRYNKGLSMP